MIGTEIADQFRRVGAPSVKGRAMLVLSRKKSESIVINDDIVVTVVEVRGDKVRLGIQAPREIPVHRKEVLDAILREDSSQSEQ